MTSPHSRQVPVRIRLAALWASLTFCYLYGDYFGLYRPGKLQGMLAGAGPVGPVGGSCEPSVRKTSEVSAAKALGWPEVKVT